MNWCRSSESRRRRAARRHCWFGSTSLRDLSSLANYMALQELSFVTLGQRVLADPLHMRLHYGHPDIFDKLWFTTRGGVSKASRGINLSEDIFAGYTAVIRGGGVTMREYAQVGKGRDVGMQQIYKFEAKLSQGNAEQCSRGACLGWRLAWTFRGCCRIISGDWPLHQFRFDRGYDTSGYLSIFVVGGVRCRVSVIGSWSL